VADTLEHDEQRKPSPTPAPSAPVAAPGPPDRQAVVAIAARVGNAALAQARGPGAPAFGGSADERALRIKEAFHASRFVEDEKAALAQIRDQSPEMIRAISGSYARIQGGRSLTEEFRAYVSNAEFAEAVRWLGPASSLTDRIKAAAGNEKAILDEIEHASPIERTLAGSDPTIIDLLRDELDSAQLFKARRQLMPGITSDQLYALVVERIVGAKGWVLDDDEGGIAAALLELPRPYRYRYWQEHSGELGFLSRDERQSVQAICEGTEAQALTQAMKLATDGAGTYDDAVTSIVAGGAAAHAEQARVDAALRSGNNPDGSPLSAAQRSALLHRQADLGDVAGLMKPQRDRRTGRLTHDTFLGMLHDDVSADEFQAHAAELDVSDYERAKQQILDAVGLVTVDEASVYSAFDRLRAALSPRQLALPPAQRAEAQRQADAALRLQLRNDTAVQEALRGMGREERQITDAHVQGDPYQLALIELTDAYEGLDTDEERIFRVICGMSAEHRKRLETEQPRIYTRLTTPSPFMTKADIALVKEAIKDGRVPTDKALDWALDGLGTEDEMLEQTFAELTPEERAEYRLGYFLSQGHTLPAKDNAERKRHEQARTKFEALYDRLAGGPIAELGTDALQKALDQLLGLPALDDLKTEQGRRMAVEIWRDRIREKMSIRHDGVVFDDGVVSSKLVDLVSDTGEVQDLAAARFESVYRAALLDDTLSDDEFAVLARLAKEFDERYADHVAAVEQAAKIAGTVAAIAVAIVVTFATGGAGGPAAASLLAEYGATALWTGVAGAATKVGVSELVGGEHYDTASTEGLADAVTGFADGAMGVLAAGLTARFASLVGLSKGALAAELTAGVVEASGSALAQSAKAAGVGALKAGIEGFLAGAVGEVVMTTLDAEMWKKRVFEVIEDYGASIIRGGLLGAVTGVVVGGPLEALTTYVGVARFKSLVAQLHSRGIPQTRMATLTVRAVRGIGQADALIAKDVAAARKALREVEGELTGEELEGVWKAIGEHHKPGEDLGSLKPPKSEAAGGGGGGKDGEPPHGGGGDSDPPGPKRDPKKEAAEALAKAVAALKAKHSGHTFEPIGELVRINGQIDVHPNAIEALTEKEITDVLTASKALNDHGVDPSKLPDEAEKAFAALKKSTAFKEVSGSEGLRYRFRYQLESTVDAFLERVGAKGRKPFDDLAKLGNAERARLFDAVKLPDEFRAAGPDVQKQAAEYAFCQHPKTVQEWVDHVELFKELLERRRAALEEQFYATVEAESARTGAKDPTAARKKVSKDLLGKEVSTNKDIDNEIARKSVTDAGAAGDVTKPSDAMREEVAKVYRDNAAQLAGKLGTAKVSPELKGEELEKAVRGLGDELRISSESSAVYHPEKHGPADLPRPENCEGVPLTGNKIDDYLALARHAVANGDAKTRPGQFGGRVIEFSKTYKGERDSWSAYVLVRDDGTVSLLSYF
jgi:hypothetical protein